MTEEKTSLGDILQNAIRCHQSGQLADAEQGYRTILQTQPNHADANHNLGILAMQVGKPSQGLPFLKAALEANPSVGQFWISYIEGLLAAGNPEAARRMLDQALTRGLQGEAVDRLTRRLQEAGDQAAPPEPGPGAQPAAERTAFFDRIVALREEGQYQEALDRLAAFRKAHPDNPEALAHCAQILLTQRRVDEAAPLVQQAVTIAPSLGMAQRNLARLCLLRNEPEAARAAANRALATAQTDPENQLVLAQVLCAAKELQPAADLLAAALQARPDYAEAYAQRAWLRLNTRDQAGALEDARRAVSLKTHLDRVWAFLGSLHIQEQRLPEAVQAMEQALVHAPENVDFLVLTGDLKRLTGAVPAALAYLEQALARDPARADAWAGYGLALLRSGRREEAVRALRQSLERKPDQAPILETLGALANESGQFQEALRAFDRALALQPDNADLQANRAAILGKLGQSGEAEAAARRVLLGNPAHLEANLVLVRLEAAAGQWEAAQARLDSLAPRHGAALAYQTERIVLLALSGQRDAALQAAREMERLFPQRRIAKPLTTLFKQCDQPGQADATMSRHMLLGGLLTVLGRPGDALEHYAKVLERDPASAQAAWHRGIALQALNRPDEAIAQYAKALESDPGLAAARLDLGVALQARGRLEEAATQYAKALETDPGLAVAHANLGVALQALDRPEEALVHCAKSLELQPDLDVAHRNMGNVLSSLERVEEALAHYAKALESDPDLVDVHMQMGGILNLLGRLGEAREHYDRVLAIEPDNFQAWSSKLFLLNHGCELSPARIFREHCLFGERLEARCRGLRRPHGNDPDPERGLRLGFVSGDYRNHPAAFFMEPLFRVLREDKCTLFGYSTFEKRDSTTARLKKHLHVWRNVADLDDNATEAIIRQDGIDILFDLSGHTACNRLPLFARKPAPVQVSYLGYAGTTGLRTMDYYVMDRQFASSGQLDDQYTEKLVYLPATCQYAPPQPCPDVTLLPSLGSGTFTYGSFNHLSKLNDPLLDHWSQILAAVPNARLLIGAIDSPKEQNRIVARFLHNGIAPERLAFAPRLPLDEYLRLHGKIDLQLDAFPYNGATTTYHSLWMGVPLVTLAGRTTVGRIGLALLGHLDLPGFVAETPAEYVRLAVDWSRRPQALQEIRQGLRQRLAGSVFCASERFAPSLRRAVRQMWRRWCQGLPPESFEVRP